MKKLLIFFLAVVIYKFFLNLFSLIRLQRYEKEFVSFLGDKPSKIEEYKLQTIDLFKKAGLKDTLTPVTQPSGYGQIVSFNASVFQNFPSDRQVIAAPALSMFRNAIGVYKSRMLESINPLYWVSLVVFLPKNLLAYLGLDMESSAFKLWNVFLTFVWWLFCTFVGLFQTEIKQFIIELLGQL